MSKPRYTMREAIDQNCRDCNHDSADKGNWRVQVEACSIDSCPFYDLRPLTMASQKSRASKKPRSEAQKASDLRLASREL